MKKKEGLNKGISLFLIETSSGIHATKPTRDEHDGGKSCFGCRRQVLPSTLVYRYSRILLLWIQCGQPGSGVPHHDITQKATTY